MTIIQQIIEKIDEAYILAKKLDRDNVSHDMLREAIIDLEQMAVDYQETEIEDTRDGSIFDIDAHPSPMADEEAAFYSAANNK